MPEAKVKTGSKWKFSLNENTPESLGKKIPLGPFVGGIFGLEKGKGVN